MTRNDRRNETMPEIPLENCGFPSHPDYYVIYARIPPLVDLKAFLP